MEVGTFTAAEASTGSRTMADLALAAGAKFADSPALRHKVGDEPGWTSRSPSWPTRSGRVAAGLIELGIQPGDKVAILSNTRPEWTYACFGILAAGATCVSIYQTNSPQECHYVLNHSESRAVFVEDERAAREDPRDPRPTSRASTLIIAMEPDGDLDDAIASTSSTQRGERRAGSRRGRARGRRLARRQLPLHLHLRHHRSAEGLHAHPRQLPARDQHGRDAEHDARATSSSTSSCRSRTRSRC